MISNFRWDGAARKKMKSQVNALIDRGVPNDLRALIWMVLANDSNKSHNRLRYPELIEVGLRRIVNSPNLKEY